MNKFAIAASHTETLAAAKEVLLNGGNAADAAVSALLTSMISEACMSSPGGGGIALIKTPQNKVYALDFFCQTPKMKIGRKKEEFFPITVDFGTVTEDFSIGAGAVATPGSIAGIFDLHEAFGRMPIRDLFSPAIYQAKHGSKVDTFQEYSIWLLQEILGICGYGRHIFFQEGNPVKEGEFLKMPDLGDFLEVLSLEGKDFFYKGEISQSIDQLSKARGGHIRREDLQNYQAKIGSPFSFPYKSAWVHTAGFPSRGGGIMAAFLALLQGQQCDIPFSSTHFGILSKAICHTRELISKEGKFQDFIEKNYGFKFAYNHEIKKGGTTHFSIIDQEGMAIAVTTTNGEGSGVWIEEAGIHLNNMLGEHALMEDGFYNWRKDIRLMSMVTPTIVTSGESENVFVTGTGGAGRIPYVLAQLIHYVVDLGLDLQSATESPRMFYDDQILQTEPGFSILDRKQTNIWDSKSLFFGGPHSVYLQGEKLQAVGDSRRYGVSYVHP